LLVPIEVIKKIWQSLQSDNDKMKIKQNTPKMSQSMA